MRGTWGRVAVPRAVRGVLASLAAAVLVVLVLPFVAPSVPAEPAARVVLVVTSAVAVGSLLRRTWKGPWQARLGWLLLAASVGGHVAGTFLLGADAARLTPQDSVHVLLAVVAGAGLLLLPSPAYERRGLLRTGLDAAVAGAALTIPAAELVLTHHSLDEMPVEALHSLAAVLLATVAVAVLAQARRAGGLAIAPRVAMTVGATFTAGSDLVGHHGVPAAVSVGLLGAGAVLWALGAWLPFDGPETEREARWRERVAVLVPMAPLSVAAAVLAGSAVFDQPISDVTLGAGVLLAGALV